MDFYQERVRLAEHLDRIHQELAAMLALWTERDLPPDVLTEDEYPFQHSLDEMTAEVQAAVEMIRDRNLVWGA
jgi:hypothetical protein